MRGAASERDDRGQAVPLVLGLVAVAVVVLLALVPLARAAQQRAAARNTADATALAGAAEGEAAARDVAAENGARWWDGGQRSSTCGWWSRSATPAPKPRPSTRPLTAVLRGAKGAALHSIRCPPTSLARRARGHATPGARPPSPLGSNPSKPHAEPIRADAPTGPRRPGPPARPLPAAGSSTTQTPTPRSRPSAKRSALARSAASCATSSRGGPQDLGAVLPVDLPDHLCPLGGALERRGSAGAIDDVESFITSLGFGNCEDIEGEDATTDADHPHHDLRRHLSWGARAPPFPWSRTPRTSGRRSPTRTASVPKASGWSAGSSSRTSGSSSRSPWGAWCWCCRGRPPAWCWRSCST